MLDSPDACIIVAEDDADVLGYVYAARTAVMERASTPGSAWLRDRGAPRVVLWSAAAQALFRRAKRYF
jgi:hypothetical protein